jgi:predicted RNase H-like HicB family nuclease
MKYTVIIEEGATSWGAYVPDLPGCIVAGESRDEVRQLIREAIEFHLEGLAQQGTPLPLPHSFSEVIEVGAIS